MSGTILLTLRLLLTASLYAFLGVALMILWRDLKRQSELFPYRQPPPLELLRHEDQQVYHYTKAEISIGRDPACDCVINDKTVSTWHARLSYHHSQWWLEDWGSTNGTFLNGEPVSIPLVITSGDQLGCGQVLFTISVGEAGER